MHYYQFNIGDYAVHTAHLEPLEDLAYRRLLDLYYLTEKPIPLDIDTVSRLIRMRSHCDCVAFVLGEFFNKTAKGFINKRADNEICAYKGKSGQASKAAKARWDKEREKQRLRSDADALQANSGRNAKHKTLTINQEQRTNVKELAPQDAPPPKKRAARLPEDWNPDREYWEAAKLINPSATQEWFVGTANKFRDYWIAKSGKDATKVDWLATWRNWIRRDVENQGAPRGQFKTAAEKEAERNAYTFNLERARDF